MSKRYPNLPDLAEFGSDALAKFETRYKLAVAAYKDLPESERKQHRDPVRGKGDIRFGFALAYVALTPTLNLAPTLPVAIPTPVNTKRRKVPATVKLRDGEPVGVQFHNEADVVADGPELTRTPQTDPAAYSCGCGASAGDRHYPGCEFRINDTTGADDRPKPATADASASAVDVEAGTTTAAAPTPADFLAEGYPAVARAIDAEFREHAEADRKTCGICGAPMRMVTEHRKSGRDVSYNQCTERRKHPRKETANV